MLKKKMNRLENKTTQKISSYRKKITTLTMLAIVTAFSVVSVSAAAPTGVSTTSVNRIVDIIFWIVGIGIAAAAVVPGVFNIATGQANEDTRTRNGGIITTVIGVACIVALPVIKATFFS